MDRHFDPKLQTTVIKATIRILTADASRFLVEIVDVLLFSDDVSPLLRVLERPKQLVGKDKVLAIVAAKSQVMHLMMASTVHKGYP
mmetsp:Transcript_9096/g.27372  ORF Transcript_9096/g.27372 Transcript_9096/m.27372 type:complete len:86 (-) Transcript_9096:810-1067(-)